MAQMRSATSSGSAAGSASPWDSPGKGGCRGGSGPRPKRGGVCRGANRRTQSGELSAASSTPPGKTCAPGKKRWFCARWRSSSRKPAGLEWVQPAANITVAARRQLLELLMAGVLQIPLRKWPGRRVVSRSPINVEGLKNPAWRLPEVYLWEERDSRARAPPRMPCASVRVILALSQPCHSCCSHQPASGSTGASVEWKIISSCEPFPLNAND
ncbi:mCG147051 [Mus musculus]|uniref:Uncharacterized protein n=1 Tax=Mus musculus TaxID=10090 RepID=Q8BR17_MOUSE|nr:mCG147051 [Mus musculus]BAC32527.1 unnamed protein product [Mus musculus]